MLTRLRAEQSHVFEHDNPAPRAVADVFAQAALLARDEQRGGLLLIVDELGKSLEYAALHPQQGDVFVLQELAEAAVRSSRALGGDAPLLVLTASHQNAETYAQKLGRTHQAEWAKVGERFRHLPFFPSDAERMDMVGFALHHEPELQLNHSLDALSARCHELLPAGISNRFPDMARAAYPLHPLVLLALPALFRRTGQSHRSLFNFLCGDEPGALGRFLRETSYTPANPPLFALDALFDYAAQTLLSGWSASVLTRLWAEAVETVERARHASPQARRILKGIALLSLLRDARLPASQAVLELALCPARGEGPDVGALLEELKQRGFIAYSRAAGAYRLWEGGDVDVEAELSQARGTMGAGTTLYVATERDLCPAPRLTARRHSFETGTLRTVEVRPCAASTLETHLETDGLTMVLCLAADAEEAARAEACARKSLAPNLLVSVALETEVLRDAARDVAAAHHVEHNTPALQGDRAARRELAARRAEAENVFRAEWERLFGATGAESNASAASSLGASWFCEGREVVWQNARHFSAFLSQMADRTFHAAPILRNELINRRVLSSSAAAGRRNLIQAMLTQGASERLGMEAFPPELSMYECVLRATGLHREIEGQWRFVAPGEHDPARLRSVWQRFAAMIFDGSSKGSSKGSSDGQTSLEPRSVRTLFDEMSAPPWGLAEGVLPPLLCAFLLAHPHETTLYRESTFLPEPGVADWEVLLRRPELFSVAGCRVQGARARIVERLARGLETQPHVVPIVRELLRRVRSLPEYAWKTRRLSARVLALRAAFERARSPELLLFHDLPQALEVQIEVQTEAGQLDLLRPQESHEPDVEAFFARLNEALSEWNGAMPRLLESARDTLLEACGVSPGIEGWRMVRERAAKLHGNVADASLIPFVGRAGREGDDASVLDGTLALLANRPPSSWTDADAERFPAAARPLGRAFQSAWQAFSPDAPNAASLQRVQLEPEAEQQARKLAKRLEGQMTTSKDGTPLPPLVQRAALLELRV